MSKSQKDVEILMTFTLFLHNPNKIKTLTSQSLCMKKIIVFYLNLRWRTQWWKLIFLCPLLAVGEVKVLLIFYCFTLCFLKSKVYLIDRYQLEIGRRVTGHGWSLEAGQCGRASGQVVRYSSAVGSLLMPVFPAKVACTDFQSLLLIKGNVYRLQTHTMHIYTGSFIASIFGWWRARVGTSKINSISIDWD